MAYLPHTLLSFRGHIGTSGDVTEIWSFGLRIAGTDAPNDTTVVGDAGMAAASDAMSAFIAAGAVGFNNNVTFEQVRGYRIGPDGKARGPVTIGSPGEPQPGGNAANFHPWQCSNVISLIHRGIGPGRKGRVYLPPQGIQVDATGHISVTNAENIRSHFATFLAAVIAPTYEGTATRPVVASRVHGTLLTVDQLRCGLVTDTQRRRRNKELEHYVQGSFPG